MNTLYSRSINPCITEGKCCSGLDYIYFQGMEVEVGLKSIYGFLVVEKEGRLEDPIKWNKEYRSWFNKKEIIKISRDAQDGLVMKNSEGEAIVVNTSKVLDVKKEDNVNCSSISLTVSDVPDCKVSLKSNGDGFYLSAHKSGKITCDKLDHYLCEHFQVFINYNFFQLGNYLHAVRYYKECSRNLVPGRSPVSVWLCQPDGCRSLVQL